MDFACIHGRFQPFHNEHLEYLMMAKSKCEHIIIGITQPDITSLSSIYGIRKRVSSIDNPLTYNQRVEMITRVLDYFKVEKNSYSFIMFDIDDPEKIKENLNLSCKCYTTIREEWNNKKIQTLMSLGYQVEVLKEDYSPTRITSTNIREKVLNGDESWKDDVPKGCSDYLEEIDFVSVLNKNLS
ncbi:adenylyltransferase/cytidyltransferase family protein [Vibrio alginolyticus]|uniref:adenylyltransferase/cytidyltransferase family protein n=1 Tax=Vibrio TaxID=662 RepID=UPI001967109E|nr:MULTISPECIES: adenylyltransferase/cytidyltransferase family protein [Vibrio]EIV8672275.1 adenylyltransferase/cytidyltransferase family protein [Vibrio parahaemolyticus]EHA1205341.1 hypothetical protein [Vibrio alginolyticus]ELA6769952.1 adenylyltransferase/cytidyltransferase family protein [Vibrio alginolyticus]MBN2998788.1 adenylyltransferase/cytidyltransferase family protein [Vibrio alginolyticus]MBT0097720.1 adenylyltransferase/cytidyltransferase family protein [Vibrio alginolyticus]